MKMELGINDAEGCVRKALGLIPLLISEAYYTKVFSGSWQVIAAQLELLNRTITSIITEPSCCFWAENPLLTELLSNLVSNLQIARELAKIRVHRYFIYKRAFRKAAICKQ